MLCRHIALRPCVEELRSHRADMKSLFIIFLLAVGCGVAVGVIREYIYVNTEKNWTDAKLYCQNYYRDLANVTSMEENNHLMASGPGSGWIGLRRGYVLYFTNWCSTCPNLDANCIYTSESGLWNSDYCKFLKNFYCDRFLCLVTEKKTWEEARDFCRTNYTGLSSAISETSVRQLNLVTVGTENLWIGLHFMNGQWLWVNGKPLGSPVSMPSCPAQSYRCGALNTATNTLQIMNCNERLSFICYY
ncbi:macrophage mannose receptor 1-like [Tachysurus fulvidraco]|uniref:macrophage mannose receptor 1-like n=1 Tax=Tachysurus fulvidraco TaxID=1234273 RepID=UPI000F4F8D71|nr:macrophage mannose receptor 1-like [Tachysurus fulvidraco]